MTFDTIRKQGLRQLFVSTCLSAALVGCGASTPAPQQTVPSPFHSPFDVEYQTEESVYSPFVFAMFAQHSSQHTKAASLFVDALEIDPDSVFIAERAFMELIYAGRLQEASTVARRLLSKPDEDKVVSDNLIHLTYILDAFKQKDWSAAETRVDGLVMNNGFSFVLSPILKAWSYAAQGQEGKAQAAMAPMLADPRLRSLGLEYWAYMLDYMGKNESAITAYQELMAQERGATVQPIIAYAYLLVRMGDMEAARSLLGEHAKTYSNNRYLLRESVRIAQTGKPSNHVATPKSGVSQLFLRLATEFARGGSNMGAVVYLRLASFLSPDTDELYLLMGEMFEKVGNPQQAARAYATIARGTPSYGLARLRHISAVRAAGDTQLAIDMLREELVNSPDSRVLHTTLGDILREESRFEEATVHYTTVIEALTETKQSDWFIFFVRGICLERLGRWDEAEQDLQIANSLNPDDPNVLNYLGYSWIDRGQNIDKSKEMIQQAMEARPEDGFITDSYGWVHYLTGDYAKAVEYLEKAVRLEPDDATINDHLGDAYWRVGRRIEARFQWRHALDSGPDTEELRQTIERKIEFGLEDAL
ncbi:hypothetical protein GCM10017044_17660 [Kordiimonas sediminis]|uniref:Tetratricopeptide repeat protein n=1 Tax=Kordiimonas sediminis TaxID=1735581 RepID=A0A919ARH9_9PROT|nr:tetratricopeptide repeat protein [Kordiimonas sediminis]GHF23577.1 hypothetical protein GCM10017044_17660 [Kordiimonas sediminis]